MTLPSPIKLLPDLSYSVEDLTSIVTWRKDSRDYLFHIRGDNFRYRCLEEALASDLQHKIDLLAHSLVKEGQEKGITRQKVEEMFKKEAWSYIAVPCCPEGNADSRG
jgi:hypothetical protein